MKRQIIFLFLMISWCSYGLHCEFQVHSNGLIYSEATMNKLGIIVDSLNLNFITCDLSQPYYSLAQGMATKVKVRNKKALRLIEAISHLPNTRNAFLVAYKKKYAHSFDDKALTQVHFNDLEVTTNTLPDFVKIVWKDND